MSLETAIINTFPHFCSHLLATSTEKLDEPLVQRRFLPVKLSINSRIHLSEWVGLSGPVKDK